jgi:hypothetical protein
MSAAVPLAHAAHVLIDVAVFVVPVGAIALALLVANLRGPQR